MNLKAVEPLDGDEFRTALRDAAFEVVITDFNLKWANGVEVAHAVKEARPLSPVIMFTATGTQEVAVEAMKAGLDDYVIKSPQHYGKSASSPPSVRGSRFWIELRAGG